MGSAVSVPRLTKEQAKIVCGDIFDEAAFDERADANGTIDSASLLRALTSGGEDAVATELAALRAENARLRALTESNAGPAAVAAKEKEKKKKTSSGKKHPPLPPLLANYAEPKSALADDAATVLALQAEFEAATDAAAATALRTKLASALADLQARVVEELYQQLGASSVADDGKVSVAMPRLFNLGKIMSVCNARFFQVYDAAVVGIASDDRDAFQAFTDTAAAVQAAVAADADVAPCRQSSDDALEILAQAKALEGTFAGLLQRISGQCPGVTCRVGPLKKLYRFAEKTALRPENVAGARKVAWRFGRVCDVRRGFVQCDDMMMLRKVLCAVRDDPNVVIRRVKDRFSVPSSGGWADAMVNLSFIDDPNAHVCELQLVHSQLMAAREGMGGHRVYGKGRAAAELLEMAASFVPRGVRTAIALLCAKSYVEMQGLKRAKEFGGDNFGNGRELAPLSGWGVVPEVAGADEGESTSAACDWPGVKCFRDTRPGQGEGAAAGEGDGDRDRDGVVDLWGTLWTVLANPNAGAAAAMVAFLPESDARKRPPTAVDLSGGKSATPWKSLCFDDVRDQEGGRPLKMNKEFDLEDDGLEELGKSCPDLRAICLDANCEDMRITARGIVALARLCTKMTQVHVAQQDIGDDVLKALAKSCPELKRLDCSFCETLTNATLAELSGLVALNVSSCNCIFDMDPEDELGGPDCVRAFFQRCPGLTALNISQLPINDEFLELLADKDVAPALRDLGLSSCTDFAPDTLAALGSGCPELRSIDLRWCDNLEDEEGTEAIDALVAACPHLEKAAVRMPNDDDEDGAFLTREEAEALEDEEDY